MKIKEHNVSTGQITERDATNEELAQNKIDELERAEQREKIAADALAKAEVLARLGITEAEAALLLA